MAGTLLAVGPWRECGKIISSAMGNRWCVLHTLFFEDIPTALARMKVDLILLSGCATQSGWEGVASDVWAVRGDVPVVALGSNAGQDSLVSALIGTYPASDGDARQGRSAEEEKVPRAGMTGDFHCSEVSPTLRLLEPRTSGVCTGIRRAVEFIELHYAEPLTLADAANAASYSRCHFSKVFKQQLGMCFVSYLSRLRIRRATQLLARTDMPVTEVALEVGFNDLSHFERVFRAAHRVSPSKFRTRTKNMPDAAKDMPSFLPRPVTS